MKWITEEQVKAYATTPAKALNISIKHWQQIVDTTEKELRAMEVEYLLSPSLCGLCTYWGCCNDDCPLEISGNGCRNDDSQYRRVYATFMGWRRGGGFRTFKKEERKMLKILKSFTEMRE